MDLTELNPMSAIAGAAGGLLAVFVAGSMMQGGFIMKIIIFAVTTAVCYIVFDKIIEG